MGNSLSPHHICYCSLYIGSVLILATIICAQRMHSDSVWEHAGWSAINIPPAQVEDGEMGLIFPTVKYVHY